MLIILKCMDRFKIFKDVFIHMIMWSKVHSGKGQRDDLQPTSGKN